MSRMDLQAKHVHVPVSTKMNMQTGSGMPVRSQGPAGRGAWLVSKRARGAERGVTSRVLAALLSTGHRGGGGSTAAKGDEEAARRLATPQPVTGKGVGTDEQEEQDAEREAEWGAGDSDAATRRQAGKDGKIAGDGGPGMRQGICEGTGRTNGSSHAHARERGWQSLLETSGLRSNRAL